MIAPPGMPKIDVDALADERFAEDLRAGAGLVSGWWDGGLVGVALGSAPTNPPTNEPTSRGLSSHHMPEVRNRIVCSFQQGCFQIIATDGEKELAAELLAEIISRRWRERGKSRRKPTFDFFRDPVMPHE